MENEDIRRYFRDLISALEYCHDCAQIIHRDIKPENILIDDNDRVKLADFGISHIMDKGNDFITIKVGTNFYFAPEVCKQGGYHGKPADIWACGVVLYYMITQKMPFTSHAI